MRELLGKQIGIRLSWIVRNRKILLFSAVIAGCISCILMFFMTKNFILLCIPLSFLSILYVIPFYRYKGKKVAIRNLPYIKVFIIAIVWAFVIVGLPYYNNTEGFDFSSNAGWLFLSQLIFIIAITLPFDVRDLNYDIATNIKTFPSQFGVRNTIMLSEFLLICFILIKYYQLHIHQINTQQFISFAISTLITGVIIAFTSKKRAELFYSGLVEGTMVILYISILVLEY